MSETLPVDRSWLAFRKTLEDAIGVPLGQYKEPQMKRRLASVMARHAIDGWPAFEKAITRDGALLAYVRDTLTINVSEFYRQPERFLDLQQKWLPQLLAGRRSLRIWSAGCSIGCEPYSLAMVLAELDPRGTHTIIATDVDVPILDRARQGTGYLAPEVRSVPPAVRSRYLVEEPGGTFAVTDAIKNRVSFRRHDLLSDRYPGDLDLILCRNVVIYLTDEAKAHIYRGFSEALRPTGLLFVGGSEMIMRSHEMGFRTAGTNLYQRAA